VDKVSFVTFVWHERGEDGRRKVTAALLFKGCAAGSESLRAEGKLNPKKGNFS
jgi:hypothetical protein